MMKLVADVCRRGPCGGAPRLGVLHHDAHGVPARSDVRRSRSQIVLRRAGEVRSVADLSQSSSWSSYDQFRRLLEEAKIAVGHNPAPRANLVDLLSVVHSEIQRDHPGLGSPRELLANTTGTNALVPIRRYQANRGRTERMDAPRALRRRVRPLSGVLRVLGRPVRLIPVFFGLPQAEVVEETCQCRGDDACLFRIRWDEVDPAQSRVDYLEMRTAGSRGPAGAVAGHGHRPRLQRALRGCSPGDRRFLHAVRRRQRRTPRARTARGEPPEDLLRRDDRLRGRRHGHRSCWPARFPGTRPPSRSSRPVAVTGSSPSGNRVACSTRSPRTPSRHTAGWRPPRSTPRMPWTKRGTRPTRPRSCSTSPRRCPSWSARRRWPRRWRAPCRS